MSGMNRYIRSQHCKVTSKIHLIVCYCDFGLTGDAGSYNHSVAEVSRKRFMDITDSRVNGASQTFEWLSPRLIH